MLGNGFSDFPYTVSDPTLTSIAIVGRSLYVGGDFAVAGNRISYGLARYNLDLDFASPRINRLQLLVDGTQACSATNVNASVAYLDATGDFSQWSRIATNAVSKGAVEFKDLGAANLARRFYRVALP